MESYESVQTAVARMWVWAGHFMAVAFGGVALVIGALRLLYSNVPGRRMNFLGINVYLRIERSFRNGIIL